MPANWDSGSDSDSAPSVTPSAVHRRRHRQVVLSDSDADTPPAAEMQQGVILGGHAAQQLSSSQRSPGRHAGRLSSADRRRSPALSARCAASPQAMLASASQPTQRRAQPAETKDLAASMSQMQIYGAAAASAEPAEAIAGVAWPDASSPGFAAGAAASGHNTTAPVPAGSSNGSSDPCLTFSRSVRRGVQRLTLSDSDSEVAAGSAASQASSASRTLAAATPAQAVRRLSFAAPPSPGSAPGSRAAPASQPKASVRWADDATAGSETALLTALQGLQQEPPPAAPDDVVDLCLRPPPDPDSSPGSPELIWTAAAMHTPRRRRAVLSDGSSSEADEAEPAVPASGEALSPGEPAKPAVSPASPAGDAAPMTPWRCTPPWQSSVSRPPPRGTPATAPAVRSSARASPPAAPAVGIPAPGPPAASPAQAVTPPWMSSYKRPAAPPEAATRGNLVAIEAAAKPAAPRPRRASVRPPPEVITLSSSEDEGSEPLLATPGRSLPALLPGRGKENGGLTGAVTSMPARPLQPHNFATPQPVSRPAGRSSTTTGKKASLPFARQREELTRSLYQQYNAKVFCGKLPADLQITWSKTLSKTAGMTYYTRTAPVQAGGSWRYSAHVELSAKVVDRRERLELTLAHELCHVASWVLSHTVKPPHGSVFYRWAARFPPHFPHVLITTRHDYDIEYAFRWQCTSAACGKVYGRHSNSLDTSRKVCGQCRGRLQPLGRFNADGTPAKTRAASAFSLFVKENFASAKAAAGPQTPHRDVMKAVAELWKQQKQSAQLA